MTIAVVILNWNGLELLKQFLPSVLEHSPEATIFVADNHSSDGSVNFVKAHFPEVQIIQNSENLGFAGGYNEALKDLHFDLYALVNSDVEVTANWLKPIVELLEREEETAIVQPKIMDYKNKASFEYAGAAGGYIDAFGYPFCRGRVFQTVEMDNGQYDDETDIFWASGACFFIKHAAFENLSGFDEDFFAHQEEIDLCWRAYNLGYEIKYTPNSVVYHVGGATLQQGNAQKTYLNFRNSLWMLLKNLPKSKLLGVLLSRLVLDGLAGIQFLLQGKPKHTFAIIRAHFAFYRRFLYFYRKRENRQKAKYFRVKCLPYLYYIKKRHTFAGSF